MIKKITFLTGLRNLEAGFTLEFPAGTTLLVGDNGTGKSTLLGALRRQIILPAKATVSVERDDGTKVQYFDFERQNPRVSSGFGEAVYVDRDVERDAWEMSHGQAVARILADWDKRTDPYSFLLDEPDTGLSIKNARKIGRFFRQLNQKGHQVIAAVHNPWLMIEVDEMVYSLEHRRWMRPRQFIDTQLK